MLSLQLEDKDLEVLVQVVYINLMLEKNQQALVQVLFLKWILANHRPHRLDMFQLFTKIKIRSQFP